MNGNADGTGPSSLTGRMHACAGAASSREASWASTSEHSPDITAQQRQRQGGNPPQPPGAAPPRLSLRQLQQQMVLLQQQRMLLRQTSQQQQQQGTLSPPEAQSPSVQSQALQLPSIWSREGVVPGDNVAAAAAAAAAVGAGAPMHQFRVWNQSQHPIIVHVSSGPNHMLVTKSFDLSSAAVTTAPLKSHRHHPHQPQDYYDEGALPALLGRGGDTNNAGHGCATTKGDGPLQKRSIGPGDSSRFSIAGKAAYITVAARLGFGAFVLLKQDQLVDNQSTVIIEDKHIVESGLGADWRPA